MVFRIRPYRRGLSRYLEEKKINVEYFNVSYDALIYARALSSRSPGTHTLHLMEDGDHNFTGRRDDVVDAILQWWDVRHRGEIKTGIWVEGIKGKL